MRLPFHRAPTEGRGVYAPPLSQEMMMDWTQILKKPFIIPSLIAGLIVFFRISMLFYQFTLKKIRHHRKEQARKKIHDPHKRTDSDPI